MADGTNTALAQNAQDNSWIPMGANGTQFSFVDPITPLKLYFRTSEENEPEEGYFRVATDEELKGYLKTMPFNSEHCDPDLLRRVFGDEDGELFALIATRFWLRRSEPPEKALEVNLRSIESVQCVTEIGRSFQAKWLEDDARMRRRAYA